MQEAKFERVLAPISRVALSADEQRDVTFDATRLAAGAYVARLITGETVETRKLTVVR